MKTSKLGRYFPQEGRRAVANEVGEDLGAVRDQGHRRLRQGDEGDEEKCTGMVLLVDKMVLGLGLEAEVELERRGGTTLGYLPVEKMAQRTK